MNPLYITVFAFIIIGLVQVYNFLRHRGDGIDTQRIALITGTVVGLLVCLGCFVHSFLMIAISISLLPLVKIIIYWPSFLTAITKFFKR